MQRRHRYLDMRRRAADPVAHPPDPRSYMVKLDAVGVAALRSLLARVAQWSGVRSVRRDGRSSLAPLGAASGRTPEIEAIHYTVCAKVSLFV